MLLLAAYTLLRAAQGLNLSDDGFVLTAYAEVFAAPGSVAYMFLYYWTVVAGLALDIRPLEWVAVLLCMGLVIGAELFNTAIERLVDLVSPQWHPVAGRVKDIAAGAVLVCAVVSVAVGLIVFVPYLTRLCL